MNWVGVAVLVTVVSAAVASAGWVYWVGFPVVLLVVGTVVVRRAGYKIGGNVVVRCRQGHLFETIWVPGMSFKSLRLGWARLQRCPVGKHWSLVTPVRNADLTEKKRRFAKDHHDVRIP